MSIRQLKTLVAIAEKGSFGAAADAVCVSHAAVSQQMKSLEEDFQVSLFNRSRRSPALNQLGRAVVLKAREIVHSYDNIVQSLLGEEGMMGELTIGAVPTTMNGLVARGLSGLRANYPQLRIRVVPGLSADLVPQVERGAIDAAILTKPQYAISHLNWRPFAKEPLIVLASMQASSDDPKYLLENNPFIRFTRRAWAGAMIDKWLREKEVKVQDSMELDNLDSISVMVFNNLGVSIVPHRCVPSPHPLPLKRVELGPSAPHRTLGVLSRLESVKFRLIEALLSELAYLVQTTEQLEAIKTSMAIEQQI